MKVQITVSLDSQIPAVTKLDIAEQAADKLRELDFEYLILPERDKVEAEIHEINKEPISAQLETFGDIDEIEKRVNKMELEEVNPRKTIHELRNASSSNYGTYSADSDPLNEE